MASIDWSDLIEMDDIERGDPGDPLSLGVLADEAEEFLRSHAWCSRIEEAYCGLGIDGVVGVFLFRIVRSRDGVDEWLWVVTGDLPPAYLVCDVCSDARQALAAYIDEMSRWVEAVKAGKVPDDSVIPVDAPATKRNADSLASRLEFLQRSVVDSEEFFGHS